MAPSISVCGLYLTFLSNKKKKKKKIYVKNGDQNGLEENDNDKIICEKSVCLINIFPFYFSFLGEHSY